jgi:molybdopterin/thiamine biosynthesis adenylyltransferase
MSFFFHEALHRTPDVLERVREAQITVCGAGALGANVAENLARSGVGRLRVVDRDRVEARNLSTQPYARSDVAAFKAKALANALYRGVGAVVEARVETLTAANAAALLAASALVIDAFDNSVARAAVRDACAAGDLACVHAGLAGGYAEVIWNEEYRVPSAANDDVCDYPLARTLAVLAAAVATEVAIGYLATGERRAYTVTLADLAVRPY